MNVEKNDAYQGIGIGLFRRYLDVCHWSYQLDRHEWIRLFHCLIKERCLVGVGLLANALRQKAKG
jgi:hypothetical protein